MKDRWVEALQAQIVSASVLESATSGVWPDFELIQPCPFLRKKKYPPVLRNVAKSSACEESQNPKKVSPFRKKLYGHEKISISIPLSY